MLATMRDKLGYSGMESSSQLSLNKTKKVGFLRLLCNFLIKINALFQPVVLQERPIIHTKVSGIAELAVKYNIGEEIGKGNFGVVLSVIDKFTGKTWAMKVIEKKKVSPVGNYSRILISLVWHFSFSISVLQLFITVEE